MNNLALKIEITADHNQARAGMDATKRGLDGVTSSAQEAASAAQSTASAVQSAATSSASASSDLGKVASAADATATALTAQAAAARATAKAVSDATKSEVADSQAVASGVAASGAAMTAQASAARASAQAVGDAAKTEAAGMQAVANAADVATSAVTAQASAARASAQVVAEATRSEAAGMQTLAAATDVSTAALAAQATAARASAQAIADTTRSELADLQRLVAAMDPVAAAFQRTSAAQAQLDKGLKAGHLTAERHAQLSEMLVGSLDRVSGQAAKAASANDNLTRGANTAAAANENLAKWAGSAAYQKRQLAIQATDTAQSLMLGMPPLMVFLQQGPQMIDAVGGLGRAFSLVGGALKAIPVAAYAAGAGIAAVLVVGVSAISRMSDLAGETRMFSGVLKGLGQDAFVTTQQLHTMVETMRDAGVDKDEARGTVANLQRNQRLAQSDRSRIAGLAPDAGIALGKSAADAAKQLSDAFSGGYAAVKKLDDALGFLTARERAQIRTMMEHGDQAKALDVAYAALDRRVGGLQAGSMSQAERAFHNMGRAWSRFVDAIVTSWPVVKTIEFLAGAVGKIADFLDRDGPPVSAADADMADLEGQIAARRARLERLRQPAANDASSAIDPQRRAQFAGVEEAALASLEAQLRRLQDAHAGAKAAEAANDNERQKKEVDEVAASVGKLAGVYGTEKAARDAARASAEAKLEADEKGIKGAERDRLIRLRGAEATMADAAAIRDRNAVASVQAAQTDKVTAAYQQSLREGLKADAARQASLEALDNKQVDVAARTRQILAEGAKAAGEAAAKAVGANEAELYRLGLVAEAATGTAAAYGDMRLHVDALARSYNDVEAARATGDQAALDAAMARRDTLEGQIRDEDRLNQTIKARREIADAAGELEIARREIELANELPEIRERELALLREKLRIAQQFPNLGEEERQALLKVAEQRAALKVAAEQQQRAADETGRIWTRAAEGIQDALSSAFEAAFDKSKRAGFSFGQVLKSFLLSTASQIATAFVFKPVIGSVIGAVGAPQSWLVSQGYATPAASAAGAGGAGGGGFSFGGLDRLFGGGSSISPALDAWAMRTLGWGNAGAVSGATSATAAQAIQAAAKAPGLLNGGSATAGFGSLSNVLGIAGAVLPGLISGNYGQAIGGGLGAAAGTMLLPGIGTMVGGMLGNLVGGMFGGGDKQDPRGYAAGQIGTNGRFSAAGAHQAGLDGYNNAQDREQIGKFAAWMNTAMDSFNLSLAVDKDTINSRGAYNGLLTIGTMYGGAKDAEELARRWFTTDRSKAAGANDNGAGLTEYDYQRAQGITTWYDRDNGMSYYDRDGKAVDRETYSKQYMAWQAEQATSSAATGSGSLFKSDDPALQKVLDRLASGALSVDTTETLTKYLEFGAGFGRSKERAAAGVGTREAQGLELRYAAEDTAKGQAKALREYISTAETVYGAESQEAKDARTAARQSALAGLETVTDDAGRPLEGFAADLAAVKAQFGALAPVLEAAGISAEDAAATIATKLTGRLAKLEKDWGQGLRDQRDAVEDPRGLARRQLQRQDDQLRTEAAQLGTASAKQEAEDFIAWRTGRQEAAWAEQDQRFSAGLAQRNYNAVAVIDPRKTREAEDEARREGQRQELADARASGATASQITDIELTQWWENQATAFKRAQADRRMGEDQALARDSYAVQAGDMFQRDADDRARAVRQQRALEDATNDNEAAQIAQTNAAENEAVAKSRARADTRMGEDQAMTRQGLLVQMGLMSADVANDNQRRVQQRRELEDATSAAEVAELKRTHAVQDAAVAYQRAMDVYNQSIALEQRRGAAASSILRSVGGAANIAAADAIDRRVLEIQQQQELVTVTDATVRARMIETHAMEAQALAATQAAAAAAEAKETFGAFAEDLRKYRADLRTSDKSPLEGLAKVDEARRQFEETAAKAATGDKSAMEAVTGKADRYLELAQAAYGGNQQYAAIFGQVDAALASLQGQAQGRVSVAEQQLATLAAQATTLGTLATSLGNIERPIASVAETSEPALTAAKTTATEAEKIARAAVDQLDKQRAISGDMAATKAKAELVANDMGTVRASTSAMQIDAARTARATEGAQSAMIDLASAIRSMPAPMVSITVAAPAPAAPPAFAAGGDHGGGWALVGERGPEYAYFAGPARIYNAEQTRSLRQPANDARTAALLEQQINAQAETNALLRELLGMTGDVATVQHDADMTVIRTLVGLSRSAELAGYMTVAA